MANWLEDEERNQAVRRHDDLLQSQLRHQREEEALQHLSTFLALCDRVKGVRPGLLSIERLKVKGQIMEIIDAPYFHGDFLRGKQREIRIDCGQSATFIDAVVTEIYSNDFSTRVRRDIVLVRHACCLQDLSSWKEDQILHAIQWIMNEAKAVKDSLPGKEIMNAEGRLVVSLSAFPGKDPDVVQVLVDGKIVGCVSTSDRTNDRQKGCAFNLAIGEHRLTVSSKSNGGLSNSVTIHLVAEQVTKYEASFGGYFVRRINLKPV